LSPYNKQKYNKANVNTTTGCQQLIKPSISTWQERTGQLS